MQSQKQFWYHSGAKLFFHDIPSQKCWRRRYQQKQAFSNQIVTPIQLFAWDNGKRSSGRQRTLDLLYYLSLTVPNRPRRCFQPMSIVYAASWTVRDSQGQVIKEAHRWKMWEVKRNNGRWAAFTPTGNDTSFMASVVLSSWVIMVCLCPGYFMQSFSNLLFYLRFNWTAWKYTFLVIYQWWMHEKWL